MLDGDDMVMTENLEGFIRMLENTDADMVISNFCLMNNETKEIYDKTNFKLEEGVVKSFDEVYKEVPTAMHAITYKTSILQDNDITIDDCFYTDTQYVLYPIPYVKTVIFY